MKNIKYIAYYSDPDPSKKRNAAPSADTKLNYIISALKKDGYNVDVVSKCRAGNRDSLLKMENGYTIQKNDIPVHFVSDLTSKYRAVRFFTRLANKYATRKLIKKTCLNNDCAVVIYHSLDMYDVIKLLNKYKKSFILEVEEIYSDVMIKRKKQNRKKEDFMFSSAGAYIFSTDLLDKEINIEKKPSVVCNGTYQVEMDRNCRIFGNDLQTGGDRMIHVVYAGTLDPRKGGAAAAAAAESLPANYHVHILGFGTEKELAYMKECIEKVAKKSVAKVSYDGLLSGDDYIKFIQSCDIGLSTQNPDAAFNATSFPSKILSYMANGLRVVSIKIPAIEGSAIGDYMYYYEKQAPEEIAKAIVSVDINDAYDGRKIISELNDKFIVSLDNLLKEI